MQRVLWLLIVVWGVRADEPQARLGVAAWQEAGHTGRGVTVAVLDTGFRGYQTHLGRGLPKAITTKSFRNDGDLEAKDSTHGLLCAAIIHTLAPDATLLFANWEPDQPESFLAALAWAKEQGVQVVSCSVVIPAWGDGAGGGPVNAALSKFLAKSDLVFLAPTGNLAERHWRGPFRGSGTMHAWADDRTETTLTPWPNAPLTVDLLAPQGTTYRPRLRAEEDVVARLITTPNGGLSTRLFPKDKRYFLRVEHVAGPRAPFRLTVLGADLEHRTRTGSLVFPGDNPHVWAIGAVSHEGVRCAYSGCGDTQLTPAFVAPVPCPCVLRATPFDGTSAAVPQAAGVVTLVRGRYPEWSAAKVRTFLNSHAQPLDAPKAERGAGRLLLPTP